MDIFEDRDLFPPEESEKEKTAEEIIAEIRKRSDEKFARARTERNEVINRSKAVTEKAPASQVKEMPPQRRVPVKPDSTVQPAENKPAEENKPSPGTRIIYQAPERSAKREYVGFSAESFGNDDNREKRQTAEHKGGYAFEEELRKQNSYPERKTLSSQDRQRQVDERERRLKEEREQRERLIREQRLKEQKMKELLGDSEMEDVELSEEDGDENLDIEEIYYEAKKPPVTTGEKIRRIILAVSLTAIVVSLSVLGYQYYQYMKNEQLQEDLNSLIITEADENTKPQKPDSHEEPTTERILTVEEQWALLRQENPNLVFPNGIQLKYAKFYALNQDFVGYLSIDALGIGLPVLQSQTQNYYLRRNIYKQNSKYGCLFVPPECDMVMLSRNTNIYGHNMSDGSMFAALKNYRSLDGYKKAPVIDFDTIYGTYKWKIVGVFITNADKKQDKGYVFPYNFTDLSSDTEFMKYITLMKERSLYDTGVDILPTDKILTLTTCVYDIDDARLVVVARMVRPGENESVDTSVAKVNNAPHYPQAYYDKKKKKNPYAKAEKWYYLG